MQLASTSFYFSLMLPPLIHLLAAIWNRKLVQKYGGENCLVEPQNGSKLLSD